MKQIAWVCALLEWQLTSSAKRILKVWFPSALWLGAIALESTNLGSAEHTGRILYPIFHFLFDMNAAAFALWHALLRKSGHVVGYFTLSVLLFRSWRATFPRLSTSWCLQWSTLALLSTSLVATLDEWHQSFVPSRTGTLRDVILDSTAALLAQIVVSAVLRIQRLKAGNPACTQPTVGRARAAGRSADRGRRGGPPARIRFATGLILIFALALAGFGAEGMASASRSQSRVAALQA